MFVKEISWVPRQRVPSALARSDTRYAGSPGVATTLTAGPTGSTVAVGEGGGEGEAAAREAGAPPPLHPAANSTKETASAVGRGKAAMTGVYEGASISGVGWTRECAGANREAVRTVTGATGPS
jgi:hypothetical protein